MAEGERMFARTNMEVDGAHAIVELVVQVRTDCWGADCTIGQAVTQALESAKQRLANVLDDQKPEAQRKTDGIKLLNARCVRVICDAKAK